MGQLGTRYRALFPLDCGRVLACLIGIHLDVVVLPGATALCFQPPDPFSISMRHQLSLVWIFDEAIEAMRMVDGVHEEY